jgi:hypothetical protein
MLQFQVASRMQQISSGESVAHHDQDDHEAQLLTASRQERATEASADGQPQAQHRPTASSGRLGLRRDIWPQQPQFVTRWVTGIDPANQGR